jgi:hypothetical protein
MTYLLHALAAALLVGCASAPIAAPTKDTSMDTKVTLEPLRTVAVGPHAMLRYDGVADSRCPPGVQCIWAGELTYKFTLTAAAGNESFGLTSAKPAFDSASVAGLHIALGQNPVPPVQPANAPAPVPARPVNLSITHK